MKPFVYMDFLMGDTMHQTERTVTTLGDVFGNLGGLMEIVSIVITFIVAGVAEKLYHVSLINTFFYIKNTSGETIVGDNSDTI